MNYEKELIRLAELSSVLEPDEKERNAWLKEIKEFSNDFINHTESNPAFYKHQPSESEFTVDGKTHPFSELLKTYQKHVIETGINPASGGHLGYIPGGGLYASALGDYLADVSNEYAGMYFGSPGAVTMENALLNWMKEIFGFPKSAIGNLTSGGSIANLIALTAARDARGISGEKIENAVIYLSEQVHHCIQKALRIIGLKDVFLRYIELDENHRINTDTLNQQIAVDRQSDLEPFMIIASAGTTDTGAVDPLDKIAEIAEQNDIWFHVDAAYGGFFILVDTLKKAFQGIEKADSLVIDPHKGLFLPYGTGAVLVKNKEAVFESNHYTANYMQDSREGNFPVNPADVSPELTKHFRGLRLWFPLMLHGIEPFQACLEEKIVLTHYFRSKLSEMGFSLGPEPDLSVSYFWYPMGEDLEQQNIFNEALLKALHEDGRVFLSSTVISERYVIRMAILAFRTKKSTIDKALEMISDSLEMIS